MGFTASLLVTDAPDARRSQRRAIDSLSTLRAHSGAKDVTVTDLSRTGCAITTPADLELGTEVSIGLVGFGAFDAKIVRRSGGTYGCEFVEPIAAEIVATAFTASTVIATPVGFASGTAEIESPDAPDLSTSRWSPVYRLALIVGASGALWYGIFKLAF